MAHLGNAKVVMLGGSGGSGTSNYNNLSNKPSINGVTLSGNKTTADLNILTASANPADAATSFLNKLKVGSSTYDASAIKPFVATSIVAAVGVGTVTIHVPNNDTSTLDGRIIAVNTGSNSGGTDSTLWGLSLYKDSGGASSVSVGMVNADGSDFECALDENQLMLISLDMTNLVATVLGIIGAPTEPYLEQSVTLSTSQTTTVTFTDARILATSVIDPAISVWGIFPEDVTVASGSCTVVMPKVSTAQTVTVGIFIKR